MLNMAMKDKMVKKLLQATSDKTQLNRQALRFKKSFGEVSKALGNGSKKNDK